MPKKVHEALRKEASRKGLKGDAADRYVYGGLKKFNESKGSNHGQPQKEPKTRGMSERTEDTD